MRRHVLQVLLPAVILLGLTLLMAGCSPGEQGDGQLRFENGMAQPLLTFSKMDAPNKDSEILRYCVYVETDHDTDGDGMADLVKAFVQVPRSAVLGGYDAAAIYDPMPYPAGVFAMTAGEESYPYAEETFDYAKLYAPGKKRPPKGEVTTLMAAAEANPADWNYTAPGDPDGTSYYNARRYDYFLIRGFAVIEACGIGTYGSEGFELCGSDLERDSHKCVVEWLTGKRVAFTDKQKNRTIRADWCNGNVAMTGISYGGTLPYEVATTGVEGLKTIIPMAGITNWYDYTNSQGVTIYSKPNYTDCLASYNSGASFEDDDWTVPDPAYGAWLKQIAADEKKANGNFTGVWEGMDYSMDTDKIRCSALIVHGLNDFNVLTKQADLMYQAFKRSGQEVKMILHQDGHKYLYGSRVGAALFEELMNMWLSHYLYGVDNGIEDMAEITVQSNLDGTYHTYDSWSGIAREGSKVFKARPDAPGGAAPADAVIHSGNYDDFYVEYLADGKDPEEFFLDLDSEHAAVYPLDVPEGSTIYGVPEVHVKLSSEDIAQDNLMVSAMLMDTAEDGKPFQAYMVKQALSYTLPKKTVGSYEFGGGHENGNEYAYIQSLAPAKIFSKGWMDLCDPGAGYISSEQPEKPKLDQGRYYDYTLYMTPTVYTLGKGHKLRLMLLAQDPYKSRLDDIQDSTLEFNDAATDPVYSFTVDGASIEVDLPITDD